MGGFPLPATGRSISITLCNAVFAVKNRYIQSAFHSENVGVKVLFRYAYTDTDILNTPEEDEEDEHLFHVILISII